MTLITNINLCIKLEFNYYGFYEFFFSLKVCMQSEDKNVKAREGIQQQKKTKLYLKELGELKKNNKTGLYYDYLCSQYYIQHS